MNVLILNFQSPKPLVYLTFEDNGKVAYAYLKKNDEIVGDVWLYNRCKTPVEPEWKSKDNLPFANSKEYVTGEGCLEKSIKKENILVDWDIDENGEPLAYIYLFENLIGVVGVGDKPGYAMFAKKNSPIAKVIEIE
jgi:hypothetical protein